MNKMGLPAIKNDQIYTYADYASWPDEERWELIDGVAYNMSPAPSSRHQRIVRILSTKIDNFLSGKRCELFTAPFDVFFPEYPEQDVNEIDTIVQPDLLIVCDSLKIIEKGCLGVPDLVIEVLSPSTSKKDLNEKFHLYEKHGVKEYWIIDPGNKYIRIFHFQTDDKEAGKYDDGTLIDPSDWREKNKIAESTVLQGFQVDVTKLFDSLG